MAGAGIIKAEYGGDGLEKAIEALSKASMPALAEVAGFAGAELADITQKAFEDQKDPVEGKRWEALKNPRPDGTTEPILQFGGDLKRSMIWEAFPDGSVIFGSPKIYARIHQKGGDAGRGLKTKIPARPYMGVTKDFDRRVLGDPAVQKLLGLGENE
ncbi:MAG: phage virion morphogenesis protein [Treponema sp.]|nr:phage virion morphogenesis protein [Treponema sp.]